MKKIAILGSTGSIGTQTLDVVRQNAGELTVTALAAGHNTALLEKQIREFSPRIAAVADEADARDLRERTKDLEVTVLSGMDGLLAVAREEQAEILVTAIVGMMGIRPTIAAIEAGKGYRPGQQGDIGDGRPYHHASGKGEGGKDSPGGQRAQRDFPVPFRARRGTRLRRSF